MFFPNKRINALLVSAGVILAADPTMGQVCTPQWTALGSGATGGSGIRGVFSMTVFDDGSGPALYVMGRFLQVGGIATDGFAKWQGSTWTSFPGYGGSTSFVQMVSFDDGSGPGLWYPFAKWTGTAEVAIPAPPYTNFGTTDRFPVTVFNDGSGAALYFGGAFSGNGYNGLARWNGTSWSTVGNGVSRGATSGASVTAFGIYDDDGPGPHTPALYVGGIFDHAGGAAANGIAKWDGTTWSALGSGLVGNGASFPAVPYSMAVFDDGTGPQLYVSGYFLTAGGQSALGLARWNGSTWSSNFGATFDFDAARSMLVFDDGRGLALWLAGTSSSTTSPLRNGIARWDGVSWTTPSTTPFPGTQLSNALAVYDSGSGPGLYLGGSYPTMNGITVNNIARWGRPMCPANCDGSFNAAGCPSLSASDFGCFINRFAAGDLRGNCDGSTVNPILTCNDFMCFLNKFAAGCS